MKQTTIDDFLPAPPRSSDPENSARQLPPTAPYQRHSDTSRAAAGEIRTELSKLRALVYQHIVEAAAQGVTDEDGQITLGLDGNTYRPRRRELEQAGLVRDSGVRRKTISGRSAVAWVRT